MNNNDYTVVPLKKAVVNKYINFAKKQYDEDNIKKQKFIKNFKWKLLAVLLSIFPMSCLSAAVIMMLIWSNDLASLIALSVLAIIIVSVGIYLISNELLSLLKRKIYKVTYSAPAVFAIFSASPIPKILFSVSMTNVGICLF